MCASSGRNERNTPRQGREWRALKVQLQSSSWFRRWLHFRGRPKNKQEKEHSPRRQRHGPSHGRARRGRGADDGLAGLDDGAGVERLELDADGLRRGAGSSGDGRRSSGASRDRRWPRRGGRSLREGDDGSHCFSLKARGRVRERAREGAREEQARETTLAKKRRGRREREMWGCVKS